MSPVIEAQELTRTFSVRKRGNRVWGRADVVTALSQMSFSIAEGESVGYIGANGAGKSTTIKMACGILMPTSGSIRTCGLEPLRHRREVVSQIGVVFGQRSQLWWDLPLCESFTLLGTIHRLTPKRAKRRLAELVERLEMGHLLDTPVRQLSLGERMRGEVAAALLHEPKLIILDEPTIGLDVLSKAHLRSLLLAERETHGTTLMLTTHDMGDVEHLCERVLLVDNGTLAFDGTLKELTAKVGAERTLVLDLLDPGPDLISIPGTKHLGSEAAGVRQRLAFDPGLTTVPQVLAAVSAVAQIRDLSIDDPDIEEVVRRTYLAANHQRD